MLGAHRALPDVLAMEAVLTHPSLVKCLSNLTVRSPGKQISLWLEQKRAHSRSTALIKSLGKKSVTSAQAKRLDSLGLGVHELVELRRSHSDEGFLQCLKDKEVRSQALRNKLLKAFEHLQ